MDESQKNKRLILTPVGGCFKFKWEGGGEMAKEISGLYTSQRAAEQAVKQWQLAKFPCKRKDNLEVALDGETLN